MKGTTDAPSSASASLFLTSEDAISISWSAAEIELPGLVDASAADEDEKRRGETSANAERSLGRASIDPMAFDELGRREESGVEVWGGESRWWPENFGHARLAFPLQPLSREKSHEVVTTMAKAKSR